MNRKEYYRQYYQAHKEQKIQYSKDYYERNHETLLLRHREYNREYAIRRKEKSIDKQPALRTASH